MKTNWLENKDELARDSWIQLIGKADARTGLHIRIQLMIIFTLRLGLLRLGVSE